MKGKLIYSLPLVILSLTFISACSKEDDVPDQQAIDRQLIRDYIADNNLPADSTSTGLFYVIEEPGNSEHPTLQDDITIAYTGRLLNGSQFDSSLSATFPLNLLIKGWQEGIPLFGKGGKGILIIPSHLGYGGNSYPGIPANSVLVFDIHLINF